MCHTCVQAYASRQLAVRCGRLNCMRFTYVPPVRSADGHLAPWRFYGHVAD